MELPFNPNRLEQRNGRIDRYGQTVEPQVRYLFLRGTFEERILLRLIAKYEKQRARLTFVPNTLGITTSSDATQARLLQALLEEDTRLFQPEQTIFDFTSDDETQGADKATRELLEEIERSLHGFRQAARSNAWLGDAGLNAEERLLAEADEARRQGSRAEHVDLARFVCDAILLDGGEIVGRIENDHFAVRLPPQWLHGLEDLPGYEASQRTVRLTTRLEVMSDAEENPVGFLGRAHPLVRRALDRVRNLSFGGAATRGQDSRASAVEADVPEPSLLYTYLGKVVSRSGRELERVLAVEVARSGEAEFHRSADRWLHLADPVKMIRTTDLWEKYFEGWAGDAEQHAKKAAQEGFQPIAEAFVITRKQVLTRERSAQDEWLKQRAEEITGTITRVVPVQRGLFDQDDTSAVPSKTPVWQTIEDPAQRLAAFHVDRQQTPTARAEAEGVLRIHRRRIAHLESLFDLRESQVVPLGVLMLIPENQHGA